MQNSITIGHNASKLPLTYKGIFLKSFRPQFLCERLLDGANKMKLTATGSLKSNNTPDDSDRLDDSAHSGSNAGEQISPMKSIIGSMSFKSTRNFSGGERRKSIVGSLTGSILQRRSTRDENKDFTDTSTHQSSASLLGVYSNMEEEAREKAKKRGLHDNHHHLDTVIDDMIKELKGANRAIEIFHSTDTDGSGSIDLEEFIEAYKKINPDVDQVQLEAIFEEADIDGNGELDLEEVRLLLLNEICLFFISRKYCCL